jgi:hypothetical protein
LPRATATEDPPAEKVRVRESLFSTKKTTFRVDTTERARETPEPVSVTTTVVGETGAAGPLGVHKSAAVPTALRVSRARLTLTA